MKKLLFAIAVLCTIVVQAQYYGTPLYKEGFDAETLPVSWGLENTVKDDPCRWVSGKNADTPFSKVDVGSIYSLELTLEQGNKPYLTLTSPEINLAGKKELIVGFYGYELSYCLRGNVTFLFRVTKDNGATWTDLFDSSRGDSYNSGVKVEGWNVYRYELPAEFNEAKVKLQFVVDGKNYSGYGGLPGYLDGVFISERYDVDMEINKIYTYSNLMDAPFTGALSSAETIKADFTNIGGKPVEALELYYQVNDNEPVVESYTPPQPVQINQKITYTFKKKADFSTPLASFTIKAGVRKEGDGDLKNNETVCYARNITNSIPYNPIFAWDEGGVPMVDNDEWTADEKEYDAGYWELDKSGTFWYADNEYSDAACDAYLFSRPVYLEKGKSYEINFRTWVDSQTAGEAFNRMKVLVSAEADVDAEMLTIWENAVIGQENALNRFARYTATKTGPYYFVFNCVSQPTPDYLKVLPLGITEVKSHDIGIVSLLSPRNDTYMFTANEVIAVQLRNYGSEAIRAAEVNVSMQLGGGEVISEHLVSDIAPGEMQEFTFTRKLDLSDINAKKILTLLVAYASDQNSDNNELSVPLVSVVSGIPYIPDFGKDRFPTDEPSFWKTIDKNSDGYTFSSASDGTLNTYVFAYGGNASRPTIVLDQSDEQLFSRSFWLEGGNTYRLSFLSRIGKANGLIPVTVALYRVNGDQHTLVKQVASVNAISATYTETLSDVNVDQSGIYELCFNVVMSDPIDYKVYLGGFKLNRVYDYNLELTNILLPSTTVSCYDQFPVGVLVTNTGKKEIGSFTIKASSVSAGNRQVLIEKSVAPGQSVPCYFNEDFVFNGEGEEKVTATVEAGEDQNFDSNSKTVIVKYIAPATIPYSTAFFNRPEGWLTVNNNRDADCFESVTGTSGGFRYQRTGNGNAGDLLATTCLFLEKDKLYQILARPKVMQKGDSASFDIYAYNSRTKEKIAIAAFRNLTDENGSQYYGYFRVPQNDSYCICFDLADNTESILFYNRFEVKEVFEQPDIHVTAVVSPLQDAVFSSDETVKVKFVNEGKIDLSTALFTLGIGDKIYHAIYTGVILENKEYEVSFTHVDLERIGEYRMKISAQVTCDATPQNNEMEYVLKSLPVINVSLVGLESPQSGVLTAQEPIVVRVKNSGKGELKNIQLTAVVTNKDDVKQTLAGIIETALPEGETVNYTFSGRVNMYVEGTYEIEVSSALEGDVDPVDNVLKTSVVSTHKDFDAGVSRLVTPVNGLLGDEAVTITVQNHTDIDMFNVPVTSVLKFLTGASIAPVTLTGTLEKLPAGGTADYTFTQKAAMKSPGDYRVQSYTSLKNDVNLANDTLTVIVRSYKKDAGVVMIVNPQSGAGLQSQSITVKVRNFGEVPLSRIPIRYKTGSIPQLGTITETIEPGETVDYTFDAPYEFTAYKVYTLTAYTELKDDFDTTNDTCVKEIENYKPDGISTVGSGRVSVYPNPVKDMVNIETGESCIYSIMIFSGEGINVLNYDSIGTSFYQMHVRLSPGNYIMRVNTSGGISYHKLIIK